MNLRIFQTGPQSGMSDFFAFERGENRKIYESEDAQEIGSLVLALRQSNPDAKAKVSKEHGYSYHVLFKAADGQGLLYYLYFMPTNANSTCIVRPNTRTGYFYGNSDVGAWLKERELALD